MPSTRAPTLDHALAERKRFYNSARWLKLRAAFLRANPLCLDCEARGDLTPATTPHHVEERLANPDRALDWDNLRPLCSSCHSKRHRRRPM
jgi:5-methylcytosine-specific restriction protein A